jgi:uncharacterized DUF497 family protein
VRIEDIICSPAVEEKLIAKPDVTCREARQVVLGQPRFRFVERGHTVGEDLFAAFGRTLGGRYLAVYFIFKPEIRTSLIITARTMTDRERKTYGRK